MKLFILCLLVSSQAWAFRLSTNINATFADKNVKIFVTSNSTCTQAGISPAELLEIAVDGVNKFWNTVPTSSLRLERGGILNTTNPLFLTGILCASDSESTCDVTTSVPAVTDIVIACNNNTTDNFPSASYLGLSAPTVLSGSKIKGSIILINDSAASAFSKLSRSEMESVLAHEIGHAIGIGHSNKNEALMYYKNSDKMHRLAQDDIDAISYLYPNKLDGCGLFGGIINFNQKNKNGNNFILSLIFGLSLGLLLNFATKHITRHVKTDRQLS